MTPKRNLLYTWILLISLIFIMMFTMSCAGETSTLSPTTPLPTNTYPTSTTPSQTPISNQDISGMAVSLRGSEEVPAVATQASAQLLLNLDSPTGELGFKLTVADILDVTMAHLHLGSQGVNGPPVVWLYPITGSAQTISGLYNGVLSEGIIYSTNFIGPLQQQPFTSLVEKIKAGEIYVNVHTVQNPNGEIRGQLEYTVPTTPRSTNYIESFGTVQSLAGNTLVIQKNEGNTLTLSITPETWIQMPDGSKGSPADLKTGTNVEIYTTVDAGNLYKVELRDQNNISSGFVSGTIGQPGSGLVIEDVTGKAYNLQITTFSQIYKADGSRGSVVDLKPGTKVEVYYNASNRVVFKVEIEP